MKITRLIFTGSLLLSLLMITSCKKDKVNYTNNGTCVDSCYCEPFPQPDIVFGDPSLYSNFEDNYVSFLEVNPNNSNELVFIHDINTNTKIRYFNTQTKEYRILFDEPVIGRLSWSCHDWILFQRSNDLNLYKIKSNGDSLTQLTNGGAHHHGVWNSIGDRIVAFNQFKNSFRTEILNANGIVVDSIEVWDHQKGVWNHPTLYAGSNTQNIMILNIETKTIVEKILFKQGAMINVLGWTSLNTFLFSNGNKLFEYNLTNKSTRFLNCGCYESIFALSSTKGFSKLFGLQHLVTSLPDFMIGYSSRIITLNSDGEEQEEIIPW